METDPVMNCGDGNPGGDDGVLDGVDPAGMHISILRAFGHLVRFLSRENLRISLE